MALKDWKKKRNQSTWTKGNKLVTIIHIPSYEGKKLRFYALSSNIDSFNIQQRGPRVKTKAEAVKFAKQYMRKH